MSTAGVDFLELWIERNILPRSASENQAARLAEKLVDDAASEGLALKDLGIEDGNAETYLRDIIVHVGTPGIPGD